jgi:multiple sugar transport system permease protein
MQQISMPFKYRAMVPLFLFLMVFSTYAIIQLVQMGVSEVAFSGSQVTRTFVGLKHARTAIADPVVGIALRNTFIYVAVVVVVEGILGTALALMIGSLRRTTVIAKTLLLFPILIPPIAIGSMWRLMYDYNFGLFNMLLSLVGVQGPTWNADPSLALLTIIIVDIWHWTSFVFLIVYAGLESLPHELFEVAQVDGASSRQIRRHVILPLLRPSIATALMLRMIFAFKVFDQVYLLTNGGPGTATEVLNLYIYKVYFVQNRIGYGSFLTILLSVIVLSIIIVYRAVLARLDRE